MCKCPEIYSRRQIEKLIYSGKIDHRYAYISIYGSDEKKVNYPSNIRHLSLCMDDVKASDLDKPEEYHLKDFEAIASFIIEAINDHFPLVCQCEEGLSRSVGIAMAISEWDSGIGDYYLQDYKYTPNTLFYTHTLKALRKKAFSRKHFLENNIETVEFGFENVEVLRVDGEGIEGILISEPNPNNMREVAIRMKKDAKDVYWPFKGGNFKRPVDRFACDIDSGDLVDMIITYKDGIQRKIEPIWDENSLYGMGSQNLYQHNCYEVDKDFNPTDIMRISFPTYLDETEEVDKENLEDNFLKVDKSISNLPCDLYIKASHKEYYKTPSQYSGYDALFDDNGVLVPLTIDEIGGSYIIYHSVGEFTYNKANLEKCRLYICRNNELLKAYKTRALNDSELLSKLPKYEDIV